ncbi:UDP-glucose dehydrogenase family protein [Bacillus sinesaloumensis]|uniref:UDP-glucose dehydrogenase family protein n=1 Tax=Litchfieldia sinesaloumensis TaxID=1926280 RepID=UPI0009886FA4|nr:UDP-glucose/GDP-mannose dehydrogenase family protein [Bacillus sinesaloumensis]
MKITVAGAGYVGLVTSVCLAELGHEVICIDIQTEKVEKLQEGTSPIYEPELEPLLQRNLIEGRLYFTTNPRYAYTHAEVIFIAVGTPQQEDGTANLDDVYEVVETIAVHIENDVIISTKSTVPVGTNEKIKRIIDSKKLPHLQVDVVSNPEFLREGSAVFDFFYGDRIVIGAENDEIATVIEKIYLPLKIPIIKTDIKSAEMIKYASNAFLATKISFVNEIARMCEKVGANIDDITYGIGKDQRIGPYFLKAGIGYGGSCFPKDIRALMHTSGSLGHHFELLEAVIKVNNRQKSFPVYKAKEILSTLKGRKIAVLGLSFKPGTDDIREAASITIIKELLMEGASVIGYDPIAIKSAKELFGNTIEYTDEITTAIQGADLTIITTDWEQIKQFPLNMYHLYMKEPKIIDGRNCYPLEEVQKYPLLYISIGRPTVMNTLINRL